LIAVPDLIKEALLAYAERYPKDGQRIYCVLHFRERVADEFERLVQTQASGIDLPAEASEPAESEMLLN
jgi:hypothetical protein